MPKKYVYFLIGGVALLVIIVIIFLLQQSASTKDQTTISPSPSIANNSNQIQGSQGSSPQISETTIQKLAPEEVVRSFYTWYIAQPGVTALTSGSYQTNPYLSNDYKKIIDSFSPYNQQHDPVFCTQNKKKDFAISAATQDTNGLTQVVIQDNSPEGKPLYRVVLEKTNKQWYIVDTICMVQ